MRMERTGHLHFVLGVEMIELGNLGMIVLTSTGFLSHNL